jgi:hypothetical protein
MPSCARARACKQNCADTRWCEHTYNARGLPSGVSGYYIKSREFMVNVWLVTFTPFCVCRSASDALQSDQAPVGNLRFCITSWYIPSTGYRKTESFTASLYVVAMELRLTLRLPLLRIVQSPFSLPHRTHCPAQLPGRGIYVGYEKSKFISTCTLNK